MFFGYYLSAATMTREETGPAVPELARRMTLSSCKLDPVRALVTVLLRMPAAGIGLGDILDDSGYAHRDAAAWAIPLRQAGAQLVQDLHPGDRGPQRNPPRRDHRQREPVLPSHAQDTARTRAAATRRHPGRHHRARRTDRRANPPQAREEQPQTIRTAITGSCAPPPRARSAARTARHR